MDRVEVVVAHDERATLRVGDVFLKVDSDPSRTDIEVRAMAAAPVPTAEVLWRHPPVLALALLPGVPLGRLGEASPASPAAWAAAGAAIRRLHYAPVPAWPSRNLDALVAGLDAECAWLVEHDVVPAGVVEDNRRLAGVALRDWEPAFIHGDLQLAHVFVADDGSDRVTGILDWSEAGAGDALYDLATLTLGHPERLADVERGYGRTVDRAVIQGWWSARSLFAIRWLIAHGFDPATPGAEIDVLTRAASSAR